MSNITQKQAKTIRAIINKLSEGPRFSVDHARATYKNFLSTHSIIRELNELLPPHEQVTFARPMARNADSVCGGGLLDNKPPSNLA